MCLFRWKVREIRVQRSAATLELLDCNLVRLDCTLEKWGYKLVKKKATDMQKGGLAAVLVRPRGRKGKEQGRQRGCPPEGKSEHAVREAIRVLPRPAGRSCSTSLCACMRSRCERKQPAVLVVLAWGRTKPCTCLSCKGERLMGGQPWALAQGED